jgi:hypothetical protein
VKNTRKKLCVIRSTRALSLLSGQRHGSASGIDLFDSQPPDTSCWGFTSRNAIWLRLTAKLSAATDLARFLKGAADQWTKGILSG